MADEAGKGSDARPCLVPREQYESNWDNIDWGHEDEEEDTGR